MSAENYCPPTPPPSGRTTPQNYQFMIARGEDEEMPLQENGHASPDVDAGSATTAFQQVGWRQHVLPMFVWVLLTVEGVEQWNIVWIPEYQFFNVPMYIPGAPPERQNPGISRENSE